MLSCKGFAVFERKPPIADKVNITTNRWEASKVVYYVDSKWEAGKNLVFWCENKWQSNRTIFFVDNKWSASEIWYIGKSKWEITKD